jgi:O-antigen/teichoic acid export membrane protein
MAVETAHGRSERRQFVRNAASAYAMRAILGISVVVITPFLYRQLGAGGFGTFSVVYTIGSIYLLIESGFARGVSKLVAEQLARGNRDEVSRTIGAAVTLLAGVGVLAAVTSIAVGLLLPGLAAESARHAFQIGMIVMGVERLAFSPLSAYGAALIGYQRYDVYNVSNIVNTVVFTAGAFAVVEAGGGVLGVILVFTAAHLLMAVSVAVFMRRADRTISLRPRLGDAPTLRSLTSFSSFVLLAESMTFIGQRMDTLVIAGIRSAAAAGPYSAVLKLQTALQSLTLPVVYQLMPMASDLWARRQHHEVLRRLTFATRVVLQITLPVAVGLVLFRSDAVDLWLGEGTPEVADAILMVLMFVQIATLTAAPAEQVLVGIGRVRAVGLLTFVEGTSNLAVSVVLVYYFGAIGAAIGTLVTTAIISPLKIPIACRTLGASVWSFVRSSILVAAVSSVPPLAAMLVVRLALAEGPARLAVGALAGLLPTLAVAAWQIGPSRLVAEIRALGAARAAPEALATAGSTEP